jgi:hypothetical protein
MYLIDSNVLVYAFRIERVAQVLGTWAAWPHEVE